MPFLMIRNDITKVAADAIVNPTNRNAGVHTAPLLQAFNHWQEPVYFLKLRHPQTMQVAVGVDRHRLFAA